MKFVIELNSEPVGTCRINRNMRDMKRASAKPRIKALIMVVSEILAI